MNIADIEVRPEARVYYARMTPELAKVAAREMVEEWSYDEDAHGYCHYRSISLETALPD